MGSSKKVERDAPNPSRVVIADDEAPTRKLVRLILEGDGFDVVAEAKTADEAVAMADEHRPDVCLLDVRMPGSGLAAARQIHLRQPDTIIIMLTAFRNDQELFDAMKAGASGYLLKDMHPDRLPRAIRGALDGEAALPRDLTLRLIEEFRGRGDRRVPLPEGRSARLTAKEWEVLEFLRDGLSTAEIGERMFVNPATVRTHVWSILKKLDVSTRAEAIQAIEETLG